MTLKRIKRLLCNNSFPITVHMKESQPLEKTLFYGGLYVTYIDHLLQLAKFAC